MADAAGNVLTNGNICLNGACVCGSAGVSCGDASNVATPVCMNPNRAAMVENDVSATCQVNQNLRMVHEYKNLHF